MIQKEGPGWRLARDPSRTAYPVLIGGESWAIEVTEFEWNCLVSLLEDLLEEYNKFSWNLISCFLSYL